MKQNFEQDKSVSYRLLVSRFVIPWGIEDSKRIHAEVETSDGVCVELIPEEDFVVDCEDNFLTLKNTDVEGILRIYDGEKQELKYSIDPNIRSPHNLVRDGDLSPMYLRLENLEKHTDSIETGAKNLTEVVSVLCQKVGQVDIIQMDRDVTALASKSLEDTEEIAKLQVYVKEIKSLKKEIESLETKLRLFESRLSSQINLAPLEDRIKTLEPLKDKFSSSGDLVLRVTERNKTPGISFVGQDGKDIAQIFVRGGDLLTGRDDGAGKLSPCTKLTPDGFKVDNKTIQEYIRGEIKGRTTIRCAKLHADRKVGDVIDSSSIDNWQYPAENSGGHLSHSVASAIGLDATDKGKRWRVIGKTIGYYGWWHWIQEVIE